METIHQWILVQADTPEAAMDAAYDALDGNAWALDWAIHTPVRGGNDYLQIIADCAATQTWYADIYAAASPDAPIKDLAANHDPLNAHPDTLDTEGLTLRERVYAAAAAADIIAGTWTRYSGGYDAVTENAVYGDALDRHTKNPHTQWAVPCAINVE